MKSVISVLSQKLQSGEMTAAQLTEQYISAIEERNPQLNAYVHLTFDEARANALAADKMIKEGKATALTGIPFTLKDNIATDGLPTTCCSKILQGFKPYYDATVWQKLKAQGAVLLGKTNMDEFAMGSTGETSVYGAPLNPVDNTRVTGGSSGGGAAAVCANLAAYALGSDTGGSIRQPASFCGVVGFKPTYGAVSRYGLFAYGSSLDQIGPITQSVTDAAIIYDAIRGEDKADGTSCKTPAGKTLLRGDVNGLKIGIAEEYFDGIPSDIKAAIDGMIFAYERGGAQVVKVSIPALKSALPVYYIIACAEASSNLGRYDGIRYGYRASNYTSVDDMITKTRTEGFGKEVKKRIMLGTYVLSSGYFDAYYKKACLLRKTVERQMAEAFEKCDVLFAPTAPNTAFKRGYSGGNAVETYLSDVCTVPVNIAGLPAISIPCGADKDGLPIGVQIIGNKFADALVLDTAYFAELNNLSRTAEVEGG
ncbi:MAG: Asp-tRNA(Asn)/Glu-tRNA(Gln) amidotransferase subunit GatA, partial [Clostridia bacterium]|nr:Asp-tRNA(Asn)/Glu-tRNA(Gln) amidotransferase subunit GatA [Clostridia bacterium]